MATYPPPIQTLATFNPDNYVYTSGVNYSALDVRYLKKNGDTSYGTIVAPNFTGLASSATNSANINLTNEILQNSGCLIPFSVNTNGNQPLLTSSNLRFNPNSLILSTFSFSTTGPIQSGSAMTAGGAFTANSTSSLVGDTTATGLITANGGINCNGNFNVSSNLLIQSDATTAYIRPTNASSTLYLGSGATNYFSINSVGTTSVQRVGTNVDTTFQIIAGSATTPGAYTNQAILNLSNLGQGGGMVNNIIYGKYFSIGNYGFEFYSNGATIASLVAGNGLIMGGANNITLGNGATAPGVVQLGYNQTKNSGYALSNMTTALSAVFTTGLTIGAGTWLITARLSLSSNSVTGVFYGAIDVGGIQIDYQDATTNITGTNLISLNYSRIYISSGSVVVNGLAGFNVAGTNVFRQSANYSWLQVTRIA